MKNLKIAAELRKRREKFKNDVERLMFAIPEYTGYTRRSRLVNIYLNINKEFRLSIYIDFSERYKSFQIEVTLSRLIDDCSIRVFDVYLSIGQLYSLLESYNQIDNFLYELERRSLEVL